MSAQPLKYQLIDEETKRGMHGENSRFIDNCIIIGDKKWFQSKEILEQSQALRNFKTRPSDAWVITLPRSGTTWTQEMVWLLLNNLDYETALKHRLELRFPYFESNLIVPRALLEDYCNTFGSEADKVKLATKEDKFSPEIIASYPSPRFIKSHLPFCLLPEDLFDSGCKVVYVARNPKDVAVSYYHLRKIMTDTHVFHGDFKDFWNLFKRNLLMYTPYWEHVKEAWKRRNDPNFLFIFYEEMHNDLPKAIEKVAKFLGKSYSSEEIAKLADHLNIKNFRNNKSVNKTEGGEAAYFKESSKFIRKGQAGGWKDEFTPELEAEADEWIKENLKDTDLKFPIKL